MRLSTYHPASDVSTGTPSRRENACSGPPGTKVNIYKVKRIRDFIKDQMVTHFGGHSLRKLFDRLDMRNPSNPYKCELSFNNR